MQKFPKSLILRNSLLTKFLYYAVFNVHGSPGKLFSPANFYILARSKDHVNIFFEVFSNFLCTGGKPLPVAGRCRLFCLYFCSPFRVIRQRNLKQTSQSIYSPVFLFEHTEEFYYSFIKRVCQRLFPII